MTEHEYSKVKNMQTQCPSTDFYYFAKDLGKDGSKTSSRKTSRSNSASSNNNSRRMSTDSSKIYKSSIISKIS